MQTISVLKRKGVACMFQFVPWHKLSIVCNKYVKLYVMYVLALSDYKQPAAAAGYKPAPQLGRFKYSFGSGMHTFPYIYFTFPIFIFHVSFLLYNSLIIIVFCG